MPNRQNDALHQLIQALSKAEKRNFKLFMHRNNGGKDLKVTDLFDAIDAQENYDDERILKKLKSVNKSQLANMKTHLYRQVLASLRILKAGHSIELQMNEQLDYARLLFNKGLYHQSLKLLDRVKQLAISYEQNTFLIQVISFEKKIETLYITRSLQNRADQLGIESKTANERRENITRLSNLALQMYSWYIKRGHARNEADEHAVKQFFFENLPVGYNHYQGFYERLYIFQAFCWYAYIRQDFRMYYRYTQKWVDLFDEKPHMLDIETMHYVKGMHNLLNALFDVRHHKKLEISITQFKYFAETHASQQFENVRIQTFVYLSSAQLNQHILQGRFQQGLGLLPEVEKKLKEYDAYIDRHRILVLNYKIAMMYFGAGNFDRCIDYLQQIIQQPVDLRIDLHCYARLLHLIAHYELGNVLLVDYLTKSVYRFMAKMQRFSIIEEEIFSFLRNSFHATQKAMRLQFESLLKKLLQYENKPSESRTFAYLDIISWLQSKIDKTSMAEVLRKKYLESRR